MGEERVDFPETEVFDWTTLPDDAAITIFSFLSCRDKVSLSSTCRSLRAVSWQTQLDLRPNYCDANAASSLASRFHQLSRLWISGVCEVDANTINAFADNCKDLTDIGFIDCGKVDETALGNVLSVRFISVAGTTDLNWNLVVQLWSKLPCLIGLDVSRTDVTADTFSGFFSYSFSLKVLCALDCPELNEDATFVSNHYYKGTVLVSFFTDILKSVAMYNKNCEMSDWLERVVSSSLVRESECNPWGLGFNQGTDLLLGFLESDKVEVQARAVTALTNYSIFDHEHRFGTNDEWPELAPLGGDGISLLENLAAYGDRSALQALVQLTCIRHDGVREEAACALWDLSCEQEEVVEACGVEVLVAFAKSCTNATPQLQWMAAGFLWFLSRSETGRIAICEEGGVSPLLAVAKSDDKAANEYATAALWSLASYPINALRIIEEGGIDTIARLSSSSSSPQMTRLFSALALTYMFDKRMDEIVRMGSTCTKSVELEKARRIATEHIEAFVKTISDSQFDCIQEEAKMFCSEGEIGSFVAMLQSQVMCLHLVSSCDLSPECWSSVGAVAGGSKDELLETRTFARQVLRNMDWFSYSSKRACRCRIGNEKHCLVEDGN